MWWCFFGRGGGKHLDLSGEGLMEATGAGPVRRWIYGLVLAAVPLAYGVWCIVTRHATLRGRWGSAMELRGRTAIARGVVWVAVGLFMHLHFLWSAHPRWWRVARWGKVLCMLAFMAGIMYFVCWFLVFRVGGRG